MEFPEQTHLLDDLSAIGAIRGSKIMNIQSAYLPNQEICHARWPAANHALGPLVAPATHHVISILDPLEEHRNLFREMLQVSIHGDHDIALRGIQSCLERCGLTVIPAKFNDLHHVILPGHGLQQLQRAIAASVINQDNFEIVAVRQRRRRRFNTANKLCDRILFVVDRGNNANKRFIHGRECDK